MAMGNMFQPHGLSAKPECSPQPPANDIGTWRELWTRPALSRRTPSRRAHTECCAPEVMVGGAVAICSQRSTDLCLADRAAGHHDHSAPDAWAGVAYPVGREIDQHPPPGDRPALRVGHQSVLDRRPILDAVSGVVQPHPCAGRALARANPLADCRFNRPRAGHLHQRGFAVSGDL